MDTLQELIESEIGDFFAGFGSPGEPETPEDMQSQLLARLAPLLSSMGQEPALVVSDDGGDALAYRRLIQNFPAGTKLYASPQLPQPAVLSVPDEIPKLKDGMGFKYVKDGVRYSLNYANGWNACRSAMQGKAEPVSDRDELPVTQFKPVADLYGITSPTGSETIFTFDAVEARDFIDGGWSCQEYVELERYQAAMTNQSEQHLDMVNYQVVPDDVSRMDWLVSKTVDVREPMAYGSHSLFWSQTITDEEDDYHATKLREQIDAAMAVEQAAEPQQEVKK